MSDVYPTGQGTRTPPQSPVRTVDRKSAEVIGGGSSAAALCGLGAAVLGIIGLAGLLPIPLCAIGMIVAGAGMVFAGGAVAARFRDLRAEIAQVEGHRGEVATETGMTAEMVGGIGAIVLGILALIHLAPLPLLSVSAIVLGGTMLLGSGAAYETIDMTGADASTYKSMVATHRAASSAAGIDTLIGIAAVVLGILNLIGIGRPGTPMLSLVAVLIVGVAQLLTDSTLAGRMTAIFRHH